MAKTILCIRSLDDDLDPHIQTVIEQVKLLDSEAKFVCLNPYSRGHYIEITAGKDSELSPSCVIVVDGDRIPAQSITSVWYRMKPVILKGDEDLQGVILENFVSKEWTSVLRSLSMYFSHARWMNPLTPQVDLLNCKPSQLRLAQQVGLTVPKTTITNNPPAVEKLFSKVENGRVVFKSLTGLFVPPDIGLYTTEIAREFPSVSQDGIAYCPSIYQELVERRSDLRITVVGNKVFAVRIASQTLDEHEDRLDWRRRQDKKELYSEAQISDVLKQRLLKFQEKAGINYGAYDFLERGDDTIFLECNMGGAWLWLEEFVGIKVSLHIARYLLDLEELET